MSPLNDDVIFFTVLAAGLQPVIAPVSPTDGNIDPSQVPESAWNGLGAVLTTNLYGLPDRVEDLRARCDRLRIPLIEDAAHALHTRVGGRLIGTFGTAAAFSLSKHVGAHAGGVLVFSDEAERREMKRLTAATVREAAWGDRVRTLGSAAAEDLVVGLRLVWPARWLRRRLRLVERSGHRMPLQPTKLRAALAEVPDLDAFHTWIRVDRQQYSTPASSLVLAYALRRLRRLEADSAARVEDVRQLRRLDVAAPAVRAGDPQPLFRVPLLVHDRADVITSLERRVHGIGYIYDPPLDDYAGPEFAEPSPNGGAARAFASQVLPVDPLEAGRVLSVLAPDGYRRSRYRPGSGRPS
jgi:dTDP-4-amino-4,6-dideoxygalactose transaminase